LLTLNFSGSAGGSSALAAETRETQIYRCGKDGRDLRDAPCPESPARQPSSIRYDQPDASEVHAARERARSVAHEADALERQRLANEARARREAPGAASLSAPRAASAAQSQHARQAHPAKPPKAPKAPKTSKPRPSPAASAPR